MNEPTALIVSEFGIMDQWPKGRDIIHHISSHATLSAGYNFFVQNKIGPEILR